MAFETLEFAREESFVVVTLNRPPANAISEQLMTELNAALSSVEEDDAVRSVIITGAARSLGKESGRASWREIGGSAAAVIRLRNGLLRRHERFPQPRRAA